MRRLALLRYASVHNISFARQTRNGLPVPAGGKGKCEWCILENPYLAVRQSTYDGEPRLVVAARYANNCSRFKHIALMTIVIEHMSKYNSLNSYPLVVNMKALGATFSNTSSTFRAPARVPFSTKLYTCQKSMHERWQ